MPGLGNLSMYEGAVSANRPQAIVDSIVTGSPEQRQQELEAARQAVLRQQQEADDRAAVAASTKAVWARPDTTPQYTSEQEKYMGWLKQDHTTPYDKMTPQERKFFLSDAKKYGLSDWANSQFPAEVKTSRPNRLGTPSVPATSANPTAITTSPGIPGTPVTTNKPSVFGDRTITTSPTPAYASPVKLGY